MNVSVGVCACDGMFVGSPGCVSVCTYLCVFICFYVCMNVCVCVFV